MEMKLAYDTPETIRELFTEYTRMLVENEPAFQTYLDLQDYAAELADLTKKYGLPHGRLYIAWCDDRPVGCIGLRRLDAETCELKRLYVRPAYRGQGIAGQMMQRILSDARAIGYTAMQLDTEPFAQCAQDVPRTRLLRHPALHRQSARYNDLPAAGALNLQKIDALPACPAARRVVNYAQKHEKGERSV